MIRFFLKAGSAINISSIVFKPLLISFLSLALIACVTPHYLKNEYVASRLQEGKRDFNEGYYKKALHQLLPLACDGNADAQYGVGYMYYYGLGVAQDTDVGYFWINRSAAQGYRPAIKALEIIEPEDDKVPNPKR